MNFLSFIPLILLLISLINTGIGTIKQRFAIRFVNGWDSPIPFFQSLICWEIDARGMMFIDLFSVSANSNAIIQPNFGGKYDLIKISNRGISSIAAMAQT